MSEVSWLIEWRPRSRTHNGDHCNLRRRPHPPLPVYSGFLPSTNIFHPIDVCPYNRYLRCTVLVPVEFPRHAYREITRHSLSKTMLSNPRCLAATNVYALVSSVYLILTTAAGRVGSDSGSVFKSLLWPVLCGGARTVTTLGG